MNDLNALYTAFQTQCPDIPLENRGAYIETQLARCVAYMLDIPSAKVDGLQQYYGSNHSPLAKQMVSAFNEKFPINVPYVLELIYAIWRFRYNLCHNVRALDVTEFLNAFKGDVNPRYVDMVKFTTPPMIYNVIQAFLSEKFSA